MVDEPQGFKSSVPPVTAVTSADLALVRFHGRNADTWEAKGITPAERFRYLYSRDELGEWVPRIRQAASEARETHVLMNNCYANYGTTNAREIARSSRTSQGRLARSAPSRLRGRGPDPAARPDRDQGAKRRTSVARQRSTSGKMSSIRSERWVNARTAIDAMIAGTIIHQVSCVACSMSHRTTAPPPITA